MKKQSFLSKSMKTAGVLLFAVTALACANTAHAVSFDYSSTVGSQILFPGDTTFSFTPAVNNFQVTTGSAATSLGQITGTYNIGAITTNGTSQTAQVTGSGMFIIHGPGGFDLTATL